MYNSIQEILECKNWKEYYPKFYKDAKNFICGFVETPENYDALLKNSEFMNYMYEWLSYEDEVDIISHCIVHGTENMPEIIMNNLDNRHYGEVICVGLWKCSADQLPVYCEWLFSFSEKWKQLDGEYPEKIIGYISENYPSFLSKLIFNSDHEIRNLAIKYIKNSLDI